MKKFKIYIPPDIATNLKHIHPQAKQKLKKALRTIQDDPHTAKPLREPFIGLFSFRVAQYRIVYEIKENEGRIEILDIAKRKVIYEKLEEKLTPS